MRGIVNALILLVLASPCLLGGLSVLSYGFLGSGLLFLPENKDREVVVAMTYILSAIGSFIVTFVVGSCMLVDDMVDVRQCQNCQGKGYMGPLVHLSMDSDGNVTREERK